MPTIQAETTVRSDDQVFTTLTATFQAVGHFPDGLAWTDSDGDQTAPFGLRFWHTLASEGLSGERIAAQAAEWHATTGDDGMPLLDDARLAAALAAIGTPMSPKALAASKARQEAWIEEEDAARRAEEDGAQDESPIAGEDTAHARAVAEYIAEARLAETRAYARRDITDAASVTLWQDGSAFDATAGSTARVTIPNSPDGTSTLTFAGETAEVMIAKIDQSATSSLTFEMDVTKPGETVARTITVTVTAANIQSY